MIRARLADGTLAAYIGPDPNGGHVIRRDNGDIHTVDAFTPEFGPVRHPQWITSVYQGAVDGIASWPTLEAAREYQAGQLRQAQRIIPIGRLVEHEGLVILADSLGHPLEAAT